MVNRCRGFTLMEVLVTVGILSILGMIALPTYFNYLTESRRAEAHTTLLALAQAQEQWFTNNNTYTGTVGNLTPLIPAIIANNVNQGNYTFQITVANGTTFTVQADAVAGGPQAGDTGCTSITLTAAGAQGPAGCWID
ncbi:MAG: prepilin-type N-terminal cleavage/methylation domain-containing protein [Gammaproteobacteria bacterium]|nr:prepilin-type N-terminal cleavage/methylation domain-containing protein [Gammaproteobacteria bacterium]